MNILAIGDLHGKTEIFKLEKEFEKFDRVVFTGDYFDSFSKTIEQQISCFNGTLSLIKSNPTKYIGLLGNHDIHYLKQYFGNKPILGSGFQEKQCFRIYQLLKDNLKYFKAAHQEMINGNRLLFSHAGVSSLLIADIEKDLLIKPYGDVIKGFIDNKQYGDLINFCLFELNYNPLHYCSIPLGNDLYCGIFWCRPQQLINFGLANTIQIVGHTRVLEPKRTEDAIFVDCVTKIPKIFEFDSALGLSVIN